MIHPSQHSFPFLCQFKIISVPTTTTMKKSLSEKYGMKHELNCILLRASACHTFGCKESYNEMNVRSTQVGQHAKIQKLQDAIFYNQYKFKSEEKNQWLLQLRCFHLVISSVYWSNDFQKMPNILTSSFYFRIRPNKRNNVKQKYQAKHVQSYHCLLFVPLKNLP